MLRILTFCDYFLPGFKGGGPVQTLRLMASRLAPGYEIRVVTRDRDLGDPHRYPSLATSGIWVEIDGIPIRHLAPLQANPVEIARTIRAEAPDVLYLNSFHSFNYSFLPLVIRALLFRDIPAVLATRGEFSKSALRIRAWRKFVYRQVICRLGLLKGVVFQASTEEEARDIARVLGPERHVIVAPDLTDLRRAGESRRTRPKEPGTAHLVFLGRIAPIKNLVWFLERLRSVPRPLTLDIWGPPEDPRYERECRAVAATLPPSIEVRFRGPLAHPDVGKTLSEADALVLPSLSENFGQVVAEALAAGCPVVVSDRSPWASVEEFGSGRSLALEHERAWVSALTELADMPEAAHAAMRSNARLHAHALQQNLTHLQANLDLFAAAVNRSR